MKFAHTLKNTAVPEWRDVYIKYRPLKKAVSRLKKEFGKLDSPSPLRIKLSNQKKYTRLLQENRLSVSRKTELELQASEAFENSSSDGSCDDVDDSCGVSDSADDDSADLENARDEHSSSSDDDDDDDGPGDERGSGRWWTISFDHKDFTTHDRQFAYEVSFLMCRLQEQISIVQLFFLKKQRDLLTRFLQIYDYLDRQGLRNFDQGVCIQVIRELALSEYVRSHHLFACRDAGRPLDDLKSHSVPARTKASMVLNMEVPTLATDLNENQGIKAYYLEELIREGRVAKLQEVRPVAKPGDPEGSRSQNVIQITSQARKASPVEQKMWESLFSEVKKYVQSPLEEHTLKWDLQHHDGNEVDGQQNTEIESTTMFSDEESDKEVTDDEEAPRKNRRRSCLPRWRLSRKVRWSTKPSRGAKLRLVQKAMLELYRTTTFLNNFAVLNFEAVRKISKKIEKQLGFTVKADVMRLSSLEYAFQTPFLRELVVVYEEHYSALFSTSHAEARQELRDGAKYDLRRNHTPEVLSSGFYLGMSVALVTTCAYQLLSVLWDGRLGEGQWLSEYNPTVAVFRSYGLISLMMGLWGVNCMSWTARRINWVFIVAYPVRMGMFHILKVGLFAMTLWSLFFSLQLSSAGQAHLDTHTHITPAFWLLIVGLLCLLAPTGESAALRKSFMRTILRIATPGFSNVTFPDFFIADQLISLHLAMGDFFFAACSYTIGLSDQSICSDKSIFIRALGGGIPSTSRFIQCLRRFRDSNYTQWFPHMVNAGKYGISVTAAIFSALASSHASEYPSQQWNGFRKAWFGLHIIASIYSYAWDIFVDWGLFEKGSFQRGPRRFLRSTTMYPSNSYYVAIVIDFVFRAFWVFALIPEYNHHRSWISGNMWATIAAIVELFRRFVWNFYRMENEHVNNVGAFREVKTVPLPE